MARGEDTGSHPGRQVGRGTFPPPNPGDAAAPLPKSVNMNYKIAQNENKGYENGTPRVSGPVFANAANEQNAGLPPSPPSGWPTVQEVEDNGVMAFDNAAGQIINPKPGYNTRNAMYRESMGEKEVRQYKKKMGYK